MAKRLGLTPFHELLAHSIAAAPTMRAAADALDGALNAATRAIPHVLLYARLARDTGFAEQSGGLAELPAELLDLLAWQLHVEGYEAAVNARAKLELISGSLVLHRRRGTPWAVRTAWKPRCVCPPWCPSGFITAASRISSASDWMSPATPGMNAWRPMPFGSSLPTRMSGRGWIALKPPRGVHCPYPWPWAA